MAAEWYYAKGKQKHGPLTEAQLKELAASGELRPTDMVWKQGMKAWVKADSLTGFFPDDGPPPLPAVASNTPEDWKRQLWNRLWADKLMFLLVCLPMCFVLTFVLPSSSSFGLKDVFGLVTAGLFVAIIVLAVLRINKTVWWMKQSLAGRWVPVDPQDQELEFSGPTILRNKSLLGTFTISSDKKRMDICANGTHIETWTLITVKVTELVIKTQQGGTKCFKRYDAISNLLTETEEDKRRRRLEGLQHKWEPVNGNGPAIQFTADGAMIRFDGFAAKFTLSGEKANEIITIHVNDTESIELKVLSLSRDELVLTGDGGSVHYKRGVSISAAEAKRRSDAYHDKLKAVGKGVLLTVGAIGAGIAVLGVAAAAAGATGGGGGGASGSGPTKTCSKCGMTIPYAAKQCPYCGNDRTASGGLWSGYDA